VKLPEFKVLTFDCYGTLIDWESGIYAALQPLLARAAPGLSPDAVLVTFARHESAQEAETPGMVYSKLLATVHRRLAQAWGVTPAESEDARFGASISDWPAFPDSAGALAYLKRHYALVILSNVDRAGIAASMRRLGTELDGVFTAQDIGSYKPDPENFRYMLARLAERGIAPGQILHTAQSLFHDHVPAKQAGLATAWIDRRHDRDGWGATMPPPIPVKTDFRFESLQAMADEHQAEVSGEGAG
jgi:2-haloalkanoic acid dehalogenase type II